MPVISRNTKTPQTAPTMPGPIATNGKAMMKERLLLATNHDDCATAQMVPLRIAAVRRAGEWWCEQSNKLQVGGMRVWLQSYQDTQFHGR